MNSTNTMLSRNLGTMVKIKIMQNLSIKFEGLR